MRTKTGRVGSIVLIMSLVAACKAFAVGGAWVKTPEGYYFKVGFTSITADKEYGLQGEDRPLFGDTVRFRDGTIGISNISVYGEYGFTDWLTGVISTQYSVAVREAEDLETGLAETTSASGLSDIWVSGRVNLLPKSWKLAGAATLAWKIPTGSPNKEIPLGTGVADYEGALAFGTGFPVGEDTYGYAQVSSGYRLRNRASNEVNWHVESGVQVIPGLALQAIFDGVHSTADFDDAAMSGNNDQVFTGLVNDQSFSRFSGGVIYDLSEEMQINFLYAKALSGINTLASSSISVGVAWKANQ